MRTADTSKIQDIVQQLFRPSGALGPFSTKIDLAYLMRLLSDEAYKDLTNVKNIRNDLAHKLDHDSFDVPSIRDRCKNFILVDRHVGPIPNAGLDATQHPPQLMVLFATLLAGFSGRSHGRAFRMEIERDGRI